jgi:hypothetical protein
MLACMLAVLFSSSVLLSSILQTYMGSARFYATAMTRQWLDRWNSGSVKSVLSTDVWLETSCQ